MARKFLYVIAALVVLAIGASAVYALWGNALIRAVMVPREPFEPLKPLPPSAYADAKMWIARPDIVKDNPALWTPAGVANPQASPQAAVFFIHPTSYITTFGGAHWNARLDDSETDATARRFVASQASAFNGAGAVWARHGCLCRVEARGGNRDDERRDGDRGERAITREIRIREEGTNKQKARMRDGRA